MENPINKSLLCKIGIHRWSNDWHVTNGAKVPLWEYMYDFWTGYVECKKCNARKIKSEFVHHELLYYWERKRNG
jgi:hypothetical protein